jgi:hypothetical protein
VFDASNWECRGTGLPEGWVQVQAMSHGRYYRSLTGERPDAKVRSGDYYISSISGDTFWALRDHSITVLKAMEATGYSRESLATFKDPELQQSERTGDSKRKSSE